jgi:glycosyltransferase involved in cell wall biosynthesis
LIKAIVLISSGQPALNPRLVKEADALANAGFAVTVIYQYWNAWGTAFDKQLLPTKKWKTIRVGGSPDNEKLLYLFGRIIYKLANLIYKQVGNVGLLPETVISRTSVLLIKEAKKIKADLYIGHNLGALAATVLAAKYHNKPCGFDAEDFHRQETTDNLVSHHYKTVKYLEDKYFPALNYLTTASPLIAAEYKKLYPQLNPIIINNVFSSNFLVPSKSNKENETLKLFWFSQTIGKNRGLETVIQAIGLLNNPNITLTLLGMINPIDEIYFRNFATEKGLILNQLIFLSPVAPDDIFSIASQYDIGLALELNTPLNRDICLTNKIFTYLSAGIAIIASETAAQKRFLNNYPLVGKSFPLGDVNKLSGIIKFYCDNPDHLLNTKIAAFNLAKNELNWENESAKFIEMIKSCIK